VAALARRVDALAASATVAGVDLQRHASRLHDLVTWLAAVAEAIEMENDDAAELRAALDSILAECEFITSAPAVAA
jgi:hypothetical protein